MFSFYPSNPRPLYHSPRIYSVYPDDDWFSPHLSYLHSRPPVTGPAVRYRRTFGEYPAAEEEYNELLGAREAKLRAHAEALHRERASLRLAQLARARKERQARQFEQGLTQALARAAVSEDDDLSLHHVVPVAVMYRTSEEPLSDMRDPIRPDAQASCTDDASVEKDKVCGIWILFKILFASGPDHGSGAARCRGGEECQPTPPPRLRTIRAFCAQFRVCSSRASADDSRR
jgi:hypothetical protein